MERGNVLSLPVGVVPGLRSVLWGFGCEYSSTVSDCRRIESGGAIRCGRLRLCRSVCWCTMVCMDDLSYFQKLARALLIFDEYESGGFLSAEHDEIFAGPDPEVVSAEHRAELESYGWRPADYGGVFHKFV